MTEGAEGTEARITAQGKILGYWRDGFFLYVDQYNSYMLSTHMLHQSYRMLFESLRQKRCFPVVTVELIIKGKPNNNSRYDSHATLLKEVHHVLPSLRRRVS